MTFFFNHSRQNNLTNGENELVKIFALLYPYYIKHSRWKIFQVSVINIIPQDVAALCHIMEKTLEFMYKNYSYKPHLITLKAQ